MIENTPAVRSTAPDGSAAGETVSLKKRVGKEVSVRPELAKTMVIALPAYSGCIDGRILLQSAEDELAAVAAARRTNLPIVRCCGLFKVGACGAKFRCVKDGLSAAQLLEH
jgi:hypothetical protein